MLIFVLSKKARKKANDTMGSTLHATRLIIPGGKSDVLALSLRSLTDPTLSMNADIEASLTT
jgi:hypothetical protein